MFLLVAIGVALIVEALLPLRDLGLGLSGAARIVIAPLVGILIGLISSLLGVAGGEIIIPTLVLLFGADIKTAGTLSVMISLPTVIVGLWRYAEGAENGGADLKEIVVPMGVGSAAGATLGGLLLPYVPLPALKGALGVILIISAVRIFRTRRA